MALCWTGVKQVLSHQLSSEICGNLIIGEIRTVPALV